MVLLFYKQEAGQMKDTGEAAVKPDAAVCTGGILTGCSPSSGGLYSKEKVEGLLCYLQWDLYS